MRPVLGQANDRFQKLYEDLHDKMLRVAYRMVGSVETSEDLVQNAFLLALFRENELMRHPNPEGWLMRVLQNLALNERRRVKRHPETSLDSLLNLAGETPANALEDMLPKQLSKADREILIWRFEQNMDYDEIADRIGKKKIRLVYAGSIDRNKNIAMTCNAAEILKKEGWDVDFTVVGKVNDDKAFEEIKDKVIYLTKRPKEELIDCYRDADIFVMPSVFESFGLVYAEAMSQGLPVIYTRGQGFDNQFPEGEVGYHVSCSDAEDVAEKIKLITERYAETSRRAVKGIEKFSWQKICERYVRVYEDAGI